MANIIIENLSANVAKRKVEYANEVLRGFEYLSWKAYGIYIWLVTFESGDVISMAKLLEAHSDEDESVKNGLEELEEAELLVRAKKKVGRRNVTTWSIN